MSVYSVTRACLLSIILAVTVIIFVEVSDREVDRYMPHHIVKTFTNISQPFPLGHMQDRSIYFSQVSAHVAKDPSDDVREMKIEARSEVNDGEIMEQFGRTIDLGVTHAELRGERDQTYTDVTVTKGNENTQIMESDNVDIVTNTVGAEDAEVAENVEFINLEAASVMGKCKVPPGGFKAWNKGAVSVLTPEVEVNCSKVFSKNKRETDRIKKAMTAWKNAISDDNITEQVKNCSWLRDSFANNLYNTQLEESFPIAFTFVVYDSPQQVLRLLRLLYRPQNTYCIHPDVKSQHKGFFYSVASCFDNVIIPSKLENIVWGYYTILAAQMNCMKDLLTYRESSQYMWKYVINLCGKELPLFTNREIVSKLMKLNGTSSIITQYSGKNSYLIRRVRYPAIVNGARTRSKMNTHLWLKHRPFDLSLYYKSSSYNAISYQFGEHLVNNATALKFYKFFKNCSNPEEHFYATLFMMPGVPGGYNKDIPDGDYFQVAAAFWSSKKRKGYDCHGKIVHDVCIITAADLADAVSKKGSGHLFINKYFSNLDHTVMRCMEERIVTQNQLEYWFECGTKLKVSSTLS